MKEKRPKLIFFKPNKSQFHVPAHIFDAYWCGSGQNQLKGEREEAIS